MTELRFNPYYSLPPFITPEDGSKFPFQEGEHVTMSMVFGSPVAILPDERTSREDIRDFETELEVELCPFGKDMGDYILSEITTISGRPRSHQLRFPYDLEDILQAIITTSDIEREFPFQLGEIVNVPLTVKHVEVIDPPSISTGMSWRALLVPFGQRIGNLIAAEVTRATVKSS